jgi:hypothetical protein
MPHKHSERGVGGAESGRGGKITNGDVGGDNEKQCPKHRARGNCPPTTHCQADKEHCRYHASSIPLILSAIDCTDSRVEPG